MSIKNILKSFRNRQDQRKLLTNVFNSAGIKAQIIDVNVGAAFTQYILKLSSSTSEADILSIQDDIALSLRSPTGSIRIEYPIPDTSNIGIEVPNNERSIISFKSLIDSSKVIDAESHLTIPIGVDVKGKVCSYDIAKMPHMLISGATGSGKSQFLHNVILSLISTNKPEDLKLILVDPKRVEFLSTYKSISYLLAPVIKDVEEGVRALTWVVDEVRRRYELLVREKVRNTSTYNEKMGYSALPPVLIIVDEFSDLMYLDPTSVEKNIIRAAQLAKAVNIHFILSTSRPSPVIYTELIKANISTRVAFSTINEKDSMLIIDQSGAEKLCGKGDMLFIPPSRTKPIRLQGGFIPDEEIEDIVAPYKREMYDSNLLEILKTPYKKIYHSDAI